MSEQVIKEARPAADPTNHLAGDAPATRLSVAEALDHFAEIFSDLDPEAMREGNTVHFQSALGPTTLSVDPVNEETADGYHVTEAITVETEVFPRVHLPLDQVAVANRLAALSAIIKDPADGRLRIVSRVLNYAEFDNALPLYCYLIGHSAVLHDAGLMAAINLLCGLPESQRWPAPDVEGAAEPPPWDEVDFEQAAALLRSQGAYANAGPHELSAEFPWEHGAVSAMMGHRTSLLRMNTDLTHPLLGNGLLVQLHIPVGAGYDAGELSNDLNMMEASAVDAPPMLGAWCGQVETNSLAHVSFWPNDVHWTGDLKNIVVWIMMRAEMLREVIQD